MNLKHFAIGKSSDGSERKLAETVIQGIHMQHIIILYGA